ncbi:cortical protein marker for cell polarity-domain-containing protein [Melanogaster broomeanus]|nr:cortical protein marker for cell polarity-domain-containing protein [Melanogaster broomeanus]
MLFKVNDYEVTVLLSVLPHGVTEPSSNSIKFTFPHCEFDAIKIIHRTKFSEHNDVTLVAGVHGEFPNEFVTSERHAGIDRYPSSEDIVKLLHTPPRVVKRLLHLDRHWEDIASGEFGQRTVDAKDSEGTPGGKKLAKELRKARQQVEREQILNQRVDKQSKVASGSQFEHRPPEHYHDDTMPDDPDHSAPYDPAGEQAILCPAGLDGPGNTWLAADGNAALITVHAFASISAYGVRLGNTFQSGYGMTAFSVTSIPDNIVQTLSYDFVFTNPITLTGVQITHSEWMGAAPGLHMLQLLSSGSFASAVSDQNSQSCFASNPSNITMTGSWTPKNANTDIPATLQTVLVSTVPVGTPASQAPTFTWMPYVSASGQYNVNLIIPGCDDCQDCALRTSVRVTVFPGDGSQPYVSTVSQQVQNDAMVLVYSGPIVQSPTSASTLPPPPPATAPAVLTGVFWSNSSSSHEVAIIGGNFSFPASSSAVSQAVAIYDPVASSVTALAGAQVYGVVRALYVDTESHLYVGGEFNLSDANGNGFAIYDLTTQQWLTTVAQPLQATSGSYVAVRSITTSTYKPNTVIVAGSFAQGSTVVCQGRHSVSYAGNNQEFLIAGGVITLSGGISANIAQYSFANTTWTAIGDQTAIPGPVTAVEVNSGNSSSIFAAGRTADGSSPFMVFWDGVSWSNVGSSLQGNSNISQLLMVPLQNTHSSNSVIESDRMLMISGALSDSSFGSASSVLFDGQTSNTWIGAGKAPPSAPSATYGSGTFLGKEWLSTVTLASGLMISQQSIGVASVVQGVNGNLGVDPVDLTQANDLPGRARHLLRSYIELNNNGLPTFGGHDSSVTKSAVNFVPLTTTSPRVSTGVSMSRPLTVAPPSFS